MSWSINGVEYIPRENPLPQQPVFESVEEERSHSKVKLAGALRVNLSFLQKQAAPQWRSDRSGRVLQGI